MKNTLIDSYRNTKLVPSDTKDFKNRIIFTFHDGPKVEVLGEIDTEYEVDFIDQDANSIVYSTTIKNNMWTASTIKYYANWLVNVKQDGVIIAQETMNLTGKKVKVVFDSQSLGDLLAYIGATDEFQKRHSCLLFCVVYNADVRKIFEASYKNITFLAIDERDEDYYSVYRIGWFNQWEGRIHNDPKKMCLANIASDVLGFGRVDFRPVLNYTKKINAGRKYVCIGTQSTAQFKYWNNPRGWETVIKYLNKLGYEVWCIDRYSSFGVGKNMNIMPKGCVDKTGNYSLAQRLEQLHGAEFFIGLSSGLSWMAWAVNIPVILISGITEPWLEFFTPHRIINKNVCHGCINDEGIDFAKDDWMHCPRKKDFECTKKIDAQTVIDEIDKLQTPFYKKLMHNFDWGKDHPTDGKRILFEEIITGRQYERFVVVERGDTVMDIGAHVGVFSYAALLAEPSKLIAVEPSAIRIESLRKNLGEGSVIILGGGVGAETKFVKGGLSFDNVVEDLHLCTIQDLVREGESDVIDFLKIDCEGGEYDVFTLENFEWIKRTFRKIAGEFHLETDEFRAAFRKFRDAFLTKLAPSQYRFYSLDGVDITWSLFTDEFIQRYSEVIFSIDNREESERKDFADPILEPVVIDDTDVQATAEQAAVAAIGGRRVIVLTDSPSAVSELFERIQTKITLRERL